MNRRDFSRRLAGAVGALSLGGISAAAFSSRDRSGIPLGVDPSLRVDGDRINHHLMELAEFGKNPYGGVSRVAYSEFDKQGREYIMRLMREAQLEVSIDLAGNILGRRNGSDPNAKVLLFGSHIDSVPDGGADLSCGGAPMTLVSAPPASGSSLAAGAAAGTKLGKRYVDESGKLEVLCTKAGNGSLAANGVLLKEKEAKKLPSSD